MKKLLTLTALLGVATLSYGQGYVTFSTTSSVIKTNNANALGNIGAYNGGPASTTPGASWYFELLTAPTTTTTVDATLTGWTAVGLGTNTGTAGRMFGYNSADSQAMAVPGGSGSTTANFVVVGWSANLGTDFSAVFAGRPTTLVSGVNTYGSATWANVTSPAPAGYSQADLTAQLSIHSPGAFYGISPVGTGIAEAPAGGPYNNVWGGATGIPSLTMNYYSVSVPEPGTLALAGLGAAAMFIFRRRK